jgi:hypothetical protein
MRPGPKAPAALPFAQPENTYAATATLATGRALSRRTPLSPGCPRPGMGGFFTFGGSFAHCSGVRIASRSFAACSAIRRAAWTLLRIRTWSSGNRGWRPRCLTPPRPFAMTESAPTFSESPLS